MSKFTDIDAAFEEAQFINEHLYKPAYFLLDKESDIHVITSDEYKNEDYKTYRVIEIFDTGLPWHK